MKTTTERPADKLVTLPCTGAWQPCYPKFQYKQNIADFYVKAARYVVHTYNRYDLNNGPCQPEVTFHGPWWDLNMAKQYARSCDTGASVEEVELYWYAPSWGRIPFGQPGFVESD